MREKQVRDLLGNHNKTWKDFSQFMLGNTVGINKDESTDFFEVDVNRFLQM